MEFVSSGDVSAVLSLLSSSEIKTFYKKDVNEVVDYEFKPGNNFNGIEQHIKDGDWKIVNMSDYLGGSVKEDIPTPHSVGEAIAFGMKKIDEGKRLLVHCQMGFSRSPAITYLILCNYMDPQDAINETYKIRSTIQPNRHIVEIGDKLLGLNGLAIAALDSRVKVKTAIEESIKYWF
jgi:predicted protein tyrosine phosphatase